MGIVDRPVAMRRSAVRISLIDGVAEAPGRCLGPFWKITHEDTPAQKSEPTGSGGQRLTPTPLGISDIQGHHRCQEGFGGMSTPRKCLRRVRPVARRCVPRGDGTTFRRNGHRGPPGRRQGVPGAHAWPHSRTSRAARRTRTGAGVTEDTVGVKDLDHSPSVVARNSQAQRTAPLTLDRP